MVFGWFRRRRRAKLLAQPFPDEWQEILDTNLSIWPKLTLEEQNRLRDSIRLFVSEKNWEGCGGLEMTDEVKVTIAAQVGLLSLGFNDLDFDHVLSVLVYPDSYRVPGAKNAHSWIINETGSPRMGEAWWQGPVILSWRHALSGANGTSFGENLVLHEFAHQLDMLNGREVDGTPPMSSQDELDRWVNVMTREFNQLVHNCRHRIRSVLSCYGTTNPGEFFAVSTEAFFAAPQELREELPELYSLLSDYYRQDPAER